jgi:hypothetical protein
MNSDNFEKWVNDKVIPNLAIPSVIVMDNAPYHGMQVYKPPTKSSLKKDMLEYLRRQKARIAMRRRYEEIHTFLVS